MHKVSWKKSASKDIRPFFGAASLERCLDAAEIRLYEDGEFVRESAFTIEPSDAERLSLAIRPNISQESLVSDSVKKGDLVLVVTALQPFLKKTSIVARRSASGELPEIIAIGDAVLTELGGGGNLTVEVAICLGKHLSKKPGSPFLLGHWLSKKSFSLRAPRPTEEFNIVAMEDNEWVAMGWPAKTLYAVEYLGGFNEPVAKDRQQLATVRVHADVHKKLTVESNQALAKPMMAALAAEITAQVIAASLDEWESEDEIASNSPLSAFLKRVAKVHPMNFGELKKLAAEPGMAKLRGILHADQQSVRFIKEG